MKIKDIRAWEILDSRGQPSLATRVILEDGSSGLAKVPSGASTGSHEACELRDSDQGRYSGRGVLKAVSNIETEIKAALSGKEAEDQAGLDKAMIELDGQAGKSRLGANAILAVSLACARAAAASARMPLYQYLSKFNPNFSDRYELPIPMLNVLNGGRHANLATDIQEYLVMPIGLASLPEAIRAGAEIYQSLKRVLLAGGYSSLVGDEGGFAPSVKDNEEPFRLLSEAVAKAGYRLGQDVAFGIDAAASEFYRDGRYELKKEGRVFSGEELAAFYLGLAKKYPIVSWEDVFAEDDWESFARFTASRQFQVVGDDLYVTDTKRLRRGIEEKSTTAILIKPNQIGTLTETVAAVSLAREAGLDAVISHRSGETEDDFIADLAVGLGARQIKTGAPARSERTAKYNRLLEIALELGEAGSYAAFPFKPIV